MDDSTAIDRDDLRAAVKDVLDDSSSSASVRAMIDPVDREALDRFWRQLAEVGWASIDIADEYGGAGASFGDLAVVFIELGAHLSPGPLFASSVLGATAITTAGSDAQKAAWLPRLADGSARASVSTDIGATVSAEGEQLVLNGSWRHVPDAVGADVLVLRATQDGEDALLLVPTDADGLEIDDLEMHDRTRRFGIVTATDVRLPREAALAVGPAAQAALEAIELRGALVIACDSLGIAERVLAFTKDYLKQRVQFGREIGSFQAVKHQATDMLIDVETARVAVNDALAAFDEGRSDLAVAVSMAKSYACDAAARVAAQGVTLHGGIGFTWEHDAHFHLKRAKLNQALMGTSRMHRRRIADLTLGPAA